MTFANETDATEAFSAHSQIGGEKVNVSYAFAQTGKPQKNNNNESNEKPEQKQNKPDNTNKKATPANEKPQKKEKHKSGE